MQSQEQRINEIKESIKDIPILKGISDPNLKEDLHYAAALYLGRLSIKDEFLSPKDFFTGLCGTFLKENSQKLVPELKDLKQSGVPLMESPIGGEVTRVVQRPYLRNEYVNLIIGEEGNSNAIKNLYINAMAQAALLNSYKTEPEADLRRAQIVKSLLGSSMYSSPNEFLNVSQQRGVLSKGRTDEILAIAEQHNDNKLINNVVKGITVDDKGISKKTFEGNEAFSTLALMTDKVPAEQKQELTEISRKLAGPVSGEMTNLQYNFRLISQNSIDELNVLNAAIEKSIQTGNPNITLEDKPQQQTTPAAERGPRNTDFVLGAYRTRAPETPAVSPEERNIPKVPTNALDQIKELTKDSPILATIKDPNDRTQLHDLAARYTDRSRDQKEFLSPNDFLKEHIANQLLNPDFVLSTRMMELKGQGEPLTQTDPTGKTTLNPKYADLVMNDKQKSEALNAMVQTALTHSYKTEPEATEKRDKMVASLLGESMYGTNQLSWQQVDGALDQTRANQVLSIARDNGDDDLTVRVTQQNEAFSRLAMNSGIITGATATAILEKGLEQNESYNQKIRDEERPGYSVPLRTYPAIQLSTDQVEQAKTVEESVTPERPKEDKLKQTRAVEESVIYERPYGGPPQRPQPAIPAQDRDIPARAANAPSAEEPTRAPTPQQSQTASLQDVLTSLTTMTPEINNIIKELAESTGPAPLRNSPATAQTKPQEPDIDELIATLNTASSKSAPNIFSPPEDYLDKMPNPFENLSSKKQDNIPEKKPATDVPFDVNEIPDDLSMDEILEALELDSDFIFDDPKTMAPLERRQTQNPNIQTSPGNPQPAGAPGTIPAPSGASLGQPLAPQIEKLRPDAQEELKKSLDRINVYSLEIIRRYDELKYLIKFEPRGMGRQTPLKAEEVLPLSPLAVKLAETKDRNERLKIFTENIDNPEMTKIPRPLNSEPPDTLLDKKSIINQLITTIENLQYECKQNIIKSSLSQDVTKPNMAKEQSEVSLKNTEATALKEKLMAAKNFESQIEILNNYYKDNISNKTEQERAKAMGKVADTLFKLYCDKDTSPELKEAANNLYKAKFHIKDDPKVRSALDSVLHDNSSSSIGVKAAQLEKKTAHLPIHEEMERARINKLVNDLEHHLDLKDLYKLKKAEEQYNKANKATEEKGGQESSVKNDEVSSEKKEKRTLNQKIKKSISNFMNKFPGVLPSKQAFVDLAGTLKDSSKTLSQNKASHEEKKQLTTFLATVINRAKKKGVQDGFHR